MVADNDAPHRHRLHRLGRFPPRRSPPASPPRSAATRSARSPIPMPAPADFVRPGHVFPLIAREGGVLMRSGHTEAAVDLCRLAGLPPVGVLAELVNDDGTVKRGPQVTRLRRGARPQAGLGRRSHRLPPAEREAGRARRRVPDRDPGRPGARHRLPHRRGTPTQHLAVVFGDIGDGRGVPVALHREAVVDDVFARARAASTASMTRVAAAGRGVIVYLREGSVGVAGAGAQAARHRSAATKPRLGRRPRERLARDRPRRADPARTSACTRSG